MRKRVLALGTVLGLMLSVLSTLPAHAAYGVTITFPNGASEFYSPFSGPATIKITFNGSESDATFDLKIRPAGGNAIKTTPFFVDADDPTLFKVKNFSWPALSVSSTKTYVVAVYRGKNQVASESFQLHPPLVRITNISPNPFLPLIDDGHKDTTTVTFDLEADAVAAEGRVFRATSNGKCCGNLVRSESVTGSLSSGLNQWVWDGKKNNNDEAGLGSYYVKIWADDGVVAPSLSKPSKVTIGRYYYEPHTLEKDGIGYHHTGPVTVIERAGNCFVSKITREQSLWIICTNARFTVYWRWNLPGGSRIQKVSFVYLDSSAPCGGTKGHTSTYSTLRVGGSGQWRCKVAKARITYAKPIQS